MHNDHMIVTCKKCGVWYDMDFEESVSDDHTIEDEVCYSEDWDVYLIPCYIFSECDHIPYFKRGTDWTSLVADV